MKQLLFTVLILSVFLKQFAVFSQISIPNNYKNITDTATITELLQILEKFRYTQPDSFIYYIEITEHLSLQTNSKLHLIKSLIAKGGYYFRKGESQKALEVYNSSKRLAQEINNEDYISESDIGISAAYLLLAYYPLAEKHLIDALKYYEKTKNKKGIGGACLNMTFIKLEQKDYEHAKHYGELAYKNYLASDYKVGIARALANLCDINMNLGNYPIALEYGNKALYYTQLSNQPSLNSLIFQNIAGVYLKQNQLDSAQYYYKRSIDEAKIWGDTYVICRSKLGVANGYASQNNFKMALSIAMESYVLAEHENLIQLKAEAAQEIALYFSILGDYKKAFEYKIIASDINDSLFNKEKYKVQNEIEAIYQTQKKEETITSLSKEKEIAELKNQQSNYYIFSLLAMLIVTTSTGLLFFRYNKLNASRKTIEIEQRLLRSQMNPHFIFNAISCIQEFIMDKNPLEASSYLSNFAKLMRSILNNSSREFIPLDEEIETLEHYLKLQKLRFPNKLEYEIIVDEAIEPSQLLIPPMLTQPFIENAVNHGIAKLVNGVGILKIEFYMQKSTLILKIEDNGVGIQKKEGQKDKNHTSMATKITQTRIENFKKSYKKEVCFKIENRLNEKKQIEGTLILFQLPNKLVS